MKKAVLVVAIILFVLWLLPDSKTEEQAKAEVDSTAYARASAANRQRTDTVAARRAEVDEFIRQLQQNATPEQKAAQKRAIADVQRTGGASR